MLNHVLIALDGSTLAERAIEPAKVILKPQGKITLVSAIQNPDSAQELRDYVERIAMNLKLNGYEVDTEIREGDAAALIVQMAQVHGVEVIVMCTHGHSGLSRLLFGSVTENVLNSTPCPVLVIPNRERERVEDEAGEESASELKPGLAS
jgi:nucleotide-binding universal stress UspA family protein